MALVKGPPTPTLEILPASAPVTPAPAQSAETPYAKVAKEFTADERRVRGQVRMHGIIAGYKVAGALAATLGTAPDSIKSELHKLAKEVAAEIEAYSFND